ncbi:MAG: hypothetical protein LQ337_003520 [Flavoplaca oasis]|nr:MAG: hypothetical protein LQ337_003520 [Flavoplaca oasis]
MAGIEYPPHIPGIEYPPHIAGKLYLLDESIETLKKDYPSSRRDLLKLKIELKSFKQESSNLLLMMAARSERIKFLVKVEAREDFSNVFDETFLKLESAHEAMMWLFGRVLAKLSQLFRSR